ncbi:MAG: methylthioribulose 1-phosphate dehydratase [Ignavibacteriales bacterium]
MRSREAEMSENKNISSISEGIGNQTTIYSASWKNDNFLKLTKNLEEIGKNFYSRGWVLGTSGNFSAVLSREPLRLAITTKGSDKGKLTPAQFLEIDGVGNVVRNGGDEQPSTEASLHLAVIRCTNADAVLHTHSIWSTVLSDMHASRGGIVLEGYEMLKGLDGVGAHQHKEYLPILENSQDMIELAQRVSATLQEYNGIHGFLLRGHGLYTWGVSLEEAIHNVEILEFLMEVLVRSAQARGNAVSL